MQYVPAPFQAMDMSTAWGGIVNVAPLAKLMVREGNDASWAGLLRE